MIAKFWETLDENAELKAAFEKYSKVARERSGGRYRGPEIQPLVLRKSEDVDFQDSGGWRKYAQTAALYFSFAEGLPQGRQAETGVFAVFEIEGKKTYNHKGDGDFELRDHTVSAKFSGFRTTLTAEQDAAEKSDIRREE